MEVPNLLKDVHKCPNCGETMERYYGDLSYHCPECKKIYKRTRKGEWTRQILRLLTYFLEALLIIILRDKYQVNTFINLIIVIITIFPIFALINHLDKYFIVEVPKKENQKNKQ